MRNVIMLTAKRTGSTFLMEALNSHSNVTCYDEMFMRTRGKKEKRRGQYLYGYMKTKKNMNYKQYINWLFENDGAISFRLMYPHLTKHKKVINVITADKIPVIHLTRKNYLAHYLSSQTKKTEKVNIDTGTIVKSMASLKSRELHHLKQLKGNQVPYIEIDYDDLFGSVEGNKDNIKNYGAFNIKSDQITYINKQTSKKICDFMEVDFKVLYSNVTKRNSWNIWDHIQNDKQVRKTIGKSDFSYLIKGI